MSESVLLLNILILHVEHHSFHKKEEKKGAKQ